MYEYNSIYLNFTKIFLINYKQKFLLTPQCGSNDKNLNFGSTANLKLKPKRLEVFKINSRNIC